MNKLYFTLSLFISFTLIHHNSCSAQESRLSEDIRLNQIGFYPSGQKIAVVVNPVSDKFFIVSVNMKDTVFSGKLKKAGTWEYSNETVSKADFTKFEKQGDYVLAVPGQGYSFTFSIQPRVHFDVAKASVKAFYYQRASTALEPEFAGKWARKAGHPDTSVIIHNSAASSNRPAGSTISSPKGWYDAGDYNKYIINSGISTFTLMALYENFPAYFDTLKLNIPESKNQIPDLLDEILWNLRWMLTMQDPEDGGVYFKLTNANFDGVEMPEKATRPRYVVMKTTTSALDFAAVLAQAGRIYSKFNKLMPGFSDTCLKASEKGYAWAKKNSDIPYNQSALSDPKINTGGYGDGNFKDEFQWAAAELFVTTGKKNYYEDADVSSITSSVGLPAWPNVATLGLYSLSAHRKMIKDKYGVNVDFVAEALVSKAAEFANYASGSPYGIAMGIDPGNFSWGSNSGDANQGMLLIEAYLVNKDKSFLDAAIASLDYLLGRNATTYSFVTGYGDKSTKHPHHRPSQADGIEEPVPGLLSGGPNPGQQDKIHCPGKKYPSDLPAKSFLDEECSYASNEIAINWNAPFAFLSFGIEALKTTK